MISKSIKYIQKYKLRNSLFTNAKKAPIEWYIEKQDRDFVVSQRVETEKAIEVLQNYI